MKLSILICSLKSRSILYNRLIDILLRQENKEVEILSNIDNGEKSIGRKRNELLKQAKSDYICFIDDDDTVSKDYVSKILNALSKDVDCVGIEGIMTTNGRNPEKFIHSIRYSSWYKQNGIYYRNPNHLNPVKRSIALKSMFPEINHGEDKNYSDKIFPFLKTEEYIDTPIYNYLFVPSKQRLRNQTISHPISKEEIELLRKKYNIRGR